MAYISKVREIAARNAERYPGRLRDSNRCFPSPYSVTAAEDYFLRLECRKDTRELGDILADSLLSEVDEICPRVRENPTFSTVNEATYYTIVHTEPRWTAVLLPSVVDRFYYRDKVFAVLDSIICKQNPRRHRLLAKCVSGFHEEFVGRLLNPLIDSKAPAFVYTFGNKPWSDTEAEAINTVPSFSRAKRYEYAKSTQLLTEYISDTQSLNEWLKVPRSEIEITFILLQVISNLLVANKHIAFVHGDLHDRNILIRRTDRSFIPVDGKLVAYEFPYEAKIIDYGLSTFSYRDKTYVGYTPAPTNHESLWTDIFKMFLSCSEYSEVNRPIVESIALHFLDSTDALEELRKISKPFFISSPHQDLYDGLPDIEKVASDMLMCVDATYKVVEAAHIRESVELSEIAQVALGIKEDKCKISHYIKSYIEVFYTFLDFVDKLDTFERQYLLYIEPLRDTVLFLVELLDDCAEAQTYEEETEKMLNDYKAKKKMWARKKA